MGATKRLSTAFVGSAPSGQHGAASSSWLSQDRFGAPPLAHLAFLVLAVLLWYWAHQNLTEEVPIENRAALDAVLSGEAAEAWVVVERPSERQLLRLAGPQERLARFQSVLSEARNRAVFPYLVPTNRLPTDESIRRFELEVQLGEFQSLTGVTVPSEVQVAFAQEEVKVRFVLERRVLAPATVDTSAIIHPAAYQLAVTLPRPLSARGAWGRLQPSMGLDGRVIARVEAYDFSREIEAAAAGMFGSKRDEELAKPRRVRLRLVPVTGVEYLSLGNEGLAPVQEIEVDLHLQARNVMERVDKELPISFTLPKWMLDKGARIDSASTPSSVQIPLLVNASQREWLDSGRVRLVCDLSALRASDGVVVPGPSVDPGSGKAVLYTFEIRQPVFPLRLESTDRTVFDYRLLPEWIAQGWSEERVYGIPLRVWWVQEREGG